MLAILASLLLLFPFLTNAQNTQFTQTIKGTVKDKSVRTPLIGATVQIMVISAGEVQGDAIGQVLEALGLYGAGLQHPAADFGAGEFRPLQTGEFVVRNRCDFHVQINAVEQGAGDFRHVAFDHAGAAHTVFVGVVVIAAGAGVRCIVVKFSYPAELNTLGDHLPPLAQSVRKLQNYHNLLVRCCDATRSACRFASQTHEHPIQSI